MSALVQFPHGVLKVVTWKCTLQDTAHAHAMRCRHPGRPHRACGLPSFSATLAGVGIFQMAPYFLKRIGASPDITGHALAYLRCRAIACPALLSLFRGDRELQRLPRHKVGTLLDLQSGASVFTCNIAAGA